MALKPLCRSIVLLGVLALGGCAGGSASNLLNGAVGAPTPRGLTLRHIDAVTLAAREMTADGAAQVHGLKSRAVAGEPGLHICGYASANNASTPIYVELRDRGGEITAERGQIGATPENLAKVKFMCREHGDW